MKIFKSIFSFLNRIWIDFSFKRFHLQGSSFFLTRIIASKLNIVDLKNTELDRVTIRIIGKNNIVKAKNALFYNSTITIKGVNNYIIIDESVKLRNANIIIRGNGCGIKIGKDTTFGGIRIVNVGSQNLIDIGKECLFSDQIELWASDTHSIFDEKGEFINTEKPIKISDKVWIGSRVIILKGIKIGYGSVVGMGSVVTKDIPANAVSAGYPSRTIREKINWSLDYKNEKFLS